MDHLVAKIQQSKKYRNIPVETIARMVEWAKLRAKKEKEIEKLAKNKLHQVYGAYFDQSRTKKIEKVLATVPSTFDTNFLKSICLDILSYHASSKERLPILDVFYKKIFQQIDQPSRILDLACGLNPFTLPWLTDHGTFQYYAADIDHGSVALFNQFFQLGNFNAKAFTNDLLISLPVVKADVVFLFKTLPCLEQQEKGISLKLLSQLSESQIVVSFPAKSLGGKEKGMYTHYQSFFESLIAEVQREFVEIRFENETVYIIDKW